MAGLSLDSYQVDAVKKMKNGCILNGRVGSGKSRTGLAYYYIYNGGEINSKDYVPMKNPKDLYIITTAKKRDSGEWLDELVPFLLTPGENYYGISVVIDSWNNIKKYVGVEGAFFLFDEDKVTGKGAWVKAFLKIARANEWVILSASPGDQWCDYIPVFIANGFYKNRTQFNADHVKFAPYTNFPKIECYYNVGRLERLRRTILVNMDYVSSATPHRNYIWCDWDKEGYRRLLKDRWNIWKDEPIRNASELCVSLRRIVNSSDDRMLKTLEIMESCNKAIIFYNFDFERETLLECLIVSGYEIGEWNGHVHTEIPTSERWAYLVHYNACEGWNCVSCNNIIFYSQNYSYKNTVQAEGRIDRRNSPYTDLYYWYLASKSGIDLAIKRALDKKKKFNEGSFCKDLRF